MFMYSALIKKCNGNAIFPLDKNDKIQISLLKVAQLINFSALYFIIYKAICF